MRILFSKFPTTTYCCIVCYSSCCPSSRTLASPAAAFVPAATAARSSLNHPKQQQQQRRFLFANTIAKPRSPFEAAARKRRPLFLKKNAISSTPITKMAAANNANDNDDNACIYLDYNGTTPIDKRVLDAMMPFLTNQFGNPSSSHYYGRAPKEAIKKARSSLLSLLYNNNSGDNEAEQERRRQDGIVFTGCGTEADNLAIHLAIKSVTENNDKKIVPRIVTSNVEHPAIAEYLRALEEEGTISVTYVPVNNEGIVSVRDTIDAIENGDDAQQQPVALVTLMLANNESGSLQPVREVANYCATKSILFHTDAAQAVGKVSVALDDNDNGIGSGADMVTLVGHKFGAPKGIACLYVRPDCFRRKKKNEPKRCVLLGGGQENGKRSGTENVPYIVGMGKAAEILTTRTKPNDSASSCYQWQENARNMDSMRESLWNNIKRGVLGDGGVDNDAMIRDNGPSRAIDRLPNTLSIGFKLPVRSSVLLDRIQSRVACSAGSACHAGSGGPSVSPVLKAMNVPAEYATGTLRLSVGPSTTREEIDEASRIIADEVKRQLQEEQKRQ